ncbi:recombinase family protein [Roseomonas sp. GCM10028921]
MIPERVAVVKRLFELAADEGAGQVKLAAIFNSEQVPTSTGRTYTRGTLPGWQPSTIAKILNSRSVLGEFHHREQVSPGVYIVAPPHSCQQYRCMSEPAPLRSALLVDFDGVVSGLRDGAGPDIALRFAETPWIWLDRLANGGTSRRFLLRCCYMNPAAFIEESEGGPRRYYNTFRWDRAPWGGVGAVLLSGLSRSVRQPRRAG